MIWGTPVVSATLGETMNSPPTIRLHKYIADCGITSRRKAEGLISRGRVALNGKTITKPGVKLNPTCDIVSVEGEVIHPEAVDPCYILFNKPRGVVTTLSDPEGRKTVMDFFPMIKQRIYPVGRLDYHSEGLLFLTNDGQLAHQVMHPSFAVTKVYEVKVLGAVTANILRTLKKPYRHPGGGVRPQSVRVVGQLPEKTWLEFRLNEGRNREIRRICESADLTIDKLRRVAIGGLSIQNIAPGEFRFLSQRELKLALRLSPQSTQHPQRFISQKRTIDVRTKGTQASRTADDPYYRQYRRRG